MDNERDIGDVRYFAAYHGTVADRKDPEGLGRVRVKIPGLIEPASAWALPMTLGGGSAQMGTFFVPEEGADVFVMFLGGDPDRPIYVGGHHGKPDDDSGTPKSEAPTDVKDLDPADAPSIRTIESKYFKITMDDRDDKQSLRIVFKGSLDDADATAGDYIEIDGKAPGMVIHATAGLFLQCDGQIVIDAAGVTINGRVVSDGAQTI